MSYTVDIPGGTATLLEATEMTPRRTRAVEVIQFQHPELMAKLEQESADEAKAAAAKKAAEDAGQEYTPVPIAHPVLSEDELYALLKMQDATLYAQLADWTLTLPDGSPRPRPETIDAIQDIPLDVYRALHEAVQAGRVHPDTDPASFEPNDVTTADDASPFPNSGSLDSVSPVEPLTDSTPTP